MHCCQPLQLPPAACLPWAPHVRDVCRETLSNPAALEQALNPQNIQAMMQMQQAMQQLQGSGMFPGGHLPVLQHQLLYLHMMSRHLLHSPFQ